MSLQKHSTGEPKVKALLENLTTANNAVAELLPQKCFRLKRKDLTSQQTWCLKGNDAYAVVEIGPRRMSENEFVEFVLGSLKAAP